MKRIIAFVVGSVAVAALTAGQGVWAMNTFLAADSKESKSPADKLQEAVDDLNAGSLFMNPSGYMAGNTYVNDSMGISLAVPDSFTLMAGENSDEVKYLVVAMDEATSEAFQLVEVDLAAAGEAGITEEECLEEYKTGMEASGGFEILSEEISSAILGNDTYTLLDTDVDLDGVSGNVLSYCRIDGTKAYILTGISFESGSEGIASILGSIAPVESGIWHGASYINPLFGISLTFPENFEVTKNFSIEEGVTYPAVAVDNQNGATLQVVVMDFNEMPGGLSAYEDLDTEEILQSFNEGVGETLGISMDQGAVSDVMIGGEEFSLITVNAEGNDGSTVALCSYGRIEDDHAMVIFATVPEDDPGIGGIIDSAVPANAGTIDDGSHTYMNTSLQMSMTLPESWVVASGYTKESNWDTAFQVGDYETGESILLQVYDLDELGEEDLTEEDYAQVVRAQLDGSEESTVEDGVGKAMIDGIPYSVLTVVTDVSGLTMEQKICYHIMDDELYVFYFTAEPDNYSEGYQSVLESMSFNEL